MFIAISHITFRIGIHTACNKPIRIQIGFSKPLCLGYTGLSDALLQRYIADSAQLWEGKTDTLPISTVGATIGTHVGPGAIVLAFFDGSCAE